MSRRKGRSSDPGPHGCDGDCSEGIWNVQTDGSPRAVNNSLYFNRPCDGQLGATGAIHVVKAAC